MTTPHDDPVDQLLEIGLKDLWYPICPSSFIKEIAGLAAPPGPQVRLLARPRRQAACAGRPLPAPRRAAVAGRDPRRPPVLPLPRRRSALRRRGHARARQPRLQARRLAGHALLPRRGDAPARCSSTTRRNRSTTPPPLVLPEQLTDDAQYSGFLCYAEWKGDYRYVLDNVMDPMHGTFLHKQSHSMAEGDSTAKFGIRPTDTRLRVREGRPAQRQLRLDRMGRHRHALDAAGDPVPEDRRPGRQLHHRRQLHADLAHAVVRLPLARAQAAARAGSATPGASSTRTAWRRATGTCWSRTAC